MLKVFFGRVSIAMKRFWSEMQNIENFRILQEGCKTLHVSSQLNAVDKPLVISYNWNANHARFR